MMKYQYALIADSNGYENLWKFMDSQEFNDDSKIEMMFYRGSIFVVDLTLKDFQCSMLSNILCGSEGLIMDTWVNLPNEKDDEDLELIVDEDEGLCNTCIFRNNSFCNAHRTSMIGWEKVKACYCYADGLTMRREDAYQDDYDNDDDLNIEE